MLCSTPGFFAWLYFDRILGLVSIHNATMPLHIACMYHLSHLHSKLFILAHEMVDREPENPISWYAVGVWYLSNGKWAEARQYFSKTSLMDPRFGPAWVAFAHTFALEGEHDHAVTAYSTCARMFTGFVACFFSWTTCLKLLTI
jgi:anaphase-promoting complex subunit 6